MERSLVAGGAGLPGAPLEGQREQQRRAEGQAEGKQRKHDRQHKRKRKHERKKKGKFESKGNGEGRGSGRGGGRATGTAEPRALTAVAAAFAEEEQELARASDEPGASESGSQVEEDGDSSGADDHRQQRAAWESGQRRKRRRGDGATEAMAEATVQAEVEAPAESLTPADETESRQRASRVAGEVGVRRCPFLDTINRRALDFDMEQVCSVSLANVNVYCCLVCGVFFQGRGQNTPAFTHSVHHAHHVYLNLQTKRVFCLPDGYEVHDASLDDIRAALDPQYHQADVETLDDTLVPSRDVHHASYLPGFVGLNNLSHTDFVNVVVYALAHVPLVRNFFLLARETSGHGTQVSASGSASLATTAAPVSPSSAASISASSTSVAAMSKKELHQRNAHLVAAKFGQVVRKLWSQHNFKSTVSPQELLQAITVASKGRFQVGRASECVDFLSWFLNTLDAGLLHGQGGSKGRPARSVVREAFQGVLGVETRPHTASTGGPASRKKKNKKSTDAAPDTEEEEEQSVDGETQAEEEKQETAIRRVPFLFLPLDIPSSPLFKDEQGALVIPQVPLFDLLRKYDGEQWTAAQSHGGAPCRRRYRIVQLPRFLVLHLSRFTKNKFFTEKNPTIVSFPVKNLEVAGAKYDLITSISHESPPGQGQEGELDPIQAGSYRVHVRSRAQDQWFEIQDLHVAEIQPQMITLAEANVLVYEQQVEENV